MENEFAPFIEEFPAIQEAEAAMPDTKEVASNMLAPVFVSLEATQKTSLNISGLMDHMNRISGHEQYVQVTDAIMNDSSLSIQEKLNLKRENDEWQDQRTAKSAEIVANLQDANTRNNSAATKSWIGPVLISLGIEACLFLGFTGSGRRIVGETFRAFQH